MRFPFGFILIFCVLCLSARAADRLDPRVHQLIVGVAADWNSKTAKLLALERTAQGEWKPALGPIPVLLGKNGLAWGRGVLGTGEPGRHKAERDARAPAGVF